MGVVISSDVGSFTPTLRVTAAEKIASRNVLHELIGGGVAVTFGGAAKSTETFEFVFKSEAAALDAYTKLNTGHVFQLTDSNKPSTNRYFSVVGNLQREFQGDTADVWIVSVDTQTVVP